MLDELREYELYTCEIDDSLFVGNDYRLRKYTFIGNSFSGLSRAMEIIARKHLFDGDGSKWPDSKRMLEVENILKHWCCCRPEEGDEADVVGLGPLDPELQNLDCWVERYIESFQYVNPRTGKSDEGKSKDALKKWRAKAAIEAEIEKAKEARKNMGRSRLAPLCDVEYQMKHDQNHITYQKIIAEALRQGPLRRCYLVGKGALVKEVIRKDRKTGEQKRSNKRNWPRILAFTAMILLQSGYNREEGCADVSPGRLSDWIADDTSEPKKPLVEYFYRDERLFVDESLGGQNSMWHMNTNWLNDGQWRIVGIDDQEALERARKEIGDGRVFFDGNLEPVSEESLFGVA